MRAALYWRSASVSSSRIRCICASRSSVAVVVGATVAAISALLEEVGVLLAEARELAQHHLEVVTQRRLGAVGVVLGQARDDLAMLGDHLGQVAGHRQAEPAGGGPGGGRGLRLLGIFVSPPGGAAGGGSRGGGCPRPPPGARRPPPP